MDLPARDNTDGTYTRVDVSGFGIAVSAGDVLAIRLSTTNGATYTWLDQSNALSPLGEYVGGSQYSSNTFTPTIGINARDNGFQTFVDTGVASIPHPAALPMGLLGLCGLALTRRRRG